MQRHDAVAVWSADRKLVAHAASASRPASRAPRRDLAEACAVDTAPPQPSAPASSTTAGTAGGGIATTTASGGSGSALRMGKQGHPCASSRPGLTPQTSPG